MNFQNTTHKTKSKTLILFLLTFFTFSVFAQTPVAKFDMDHTTSNMSQVQTEGYTSWEIGLTNTKTVNGVTFTFVNTGTGKGLKSNWYKTLKDNGYPFMCDAMLIDMDDPKVSGTEITLTISGLETGSHTLLFYLNHVDNPSSNTFVPVDIYVDGVLKGDDIMPTARAATQYESQSFYTTFNATSGTNVVVKIATEATDGTTNKNIALSGFELNTPNSVKQSASPVPANGNEHIDADNGITTLQWSGANSAVSHQVYLGNDSLSVSEATTASSLYQGEQADTFLTINNLYSMDSYFWRIDEKDADGIITKGNVWMFRPRQLAFDDAEGYGKYARGGRGGKVVYVTTLEDYDPETEAVIPGSLREAVTADWGPRTVAFAVSGIIELKTRLTLNQSYVTVAGQTAPGKGITIKSAPFGMSGVNDVIIRHIRVRLGYGKTYDGMGMQGSSNCIIDHSSISWTIDEAFSSRSANNISLQRTLISEALNQADHKNYVENDPDVRHGYAASIGGDIGSFHHNLLAHCYGRNWSMAGGLDADNNFAGRLDIFNNVVYNWGTRTTDGGAHEVNFVGNYYKPGPESKKHVALTANHEDDFGGYQKYYFNGNKMPGYFDESSQEDGWVSDVEVAIDYDDFVDAPFFPSQATVQTADEAYKSVLSDVGCTQPVFDDHDRRVVRETVEGTFTYVGSKSGLKGMPDRESDVGGYEDYPALTRDVNYDTDLDGMPNWWEKTNGLDTNNTIGDFSESNADEDGDGYTNFDKYLEWAGKTHYFTNYGEEVKFSLEDMFRGYTNSPVYTVVNAENCFVNISDDTAYVTSSACGMASLEVSVNDADGHGMSKAVGLYIDSETPGACASLTSLIIQENETGFCLVDGTIDDNNANYTGSGFANTYNKADSGINYQIVVGEAGMYTFTLRYSGTEDRQANILIDDVTEVSNLSFTPTADWTTWTTVSTTIELTEGKKNIRIHPTGEKGLLNIDYLKITGTDVIAGDCSEDVVMHTLAVSAGSNGTVNDVNGDYAYGDEVEITATPDEGYRFKGWGGDASGTENPLIISMNADKAISANFELIPASYTLTATAGSNGSVSEVNGSYDEGTDVEISAIPATGFEFTGWTGDIESADNPFLVTIDADVSVTANFTVKTFSLTASAGEHGSVSDVNGTYNYGTSKQITATPSTGYEFTGWTGDITGTDNPLTVTLTSDVNVTANFAIQTFSLTAIAGDNGSVSDVDDSYDYGTSEQLTATPNTGYEFIGWSGDDTSTDNPLTVTLTNDVSVTASFSILSYDLTVIAGDNGAVADINGSYNYGSEVSITAIPDDGYEFTAWSGDINSTENPVTITIEGNMDISANFSKKDDVAVDNTLSESFTLYPNPFTNNITVDVNSELVGYTSVVVYNSVGEVVALSTVESMSALEINTEHFSSGIYIVNIVNDRNVTQYKLVKE